MRKWVAILFLLFASNCYSQQIIRANPYYVAKVQVSTYKGILDTFPGASAAYSFRRLSGNYTGPCIRIRRNSDNALLDINFTSSGFADTNLIKTFTGGVTPYVSIWYDQSGNGNNAVDSVLSTGNTVIRMNGMFAIANNGSLTYLSMLYNDTLASAFSVVRVDAVNLVNALAVKESPLNQLFISGSAVSSEYGAYDGTVVLSSSNDLARNLLYWNMVSSNLYLAKNGASATSAGAFTSYIIVNTLFSRRSSANLNTNGTIQELIMYRNEQSANKTGIENSINAFWKVY